MRDTVHYAPGERPLCGSESQTAITTEEPALVIRNLCNDGLIGTGAFPAILGLWRQPPGNPAFHPSFQRCWSTRLRNQISTRLNSVYVVV